MENRVFALLVYDRPNPLERLRLALEDLPVEIVRVRTCNEAAQIIEKMPPTLLFTDTQLPDGLWTHVLWSTVNTTRPVKVYVVGYPEDIEPYLTPIEQGVVDFLIPPFEADDLSYIVELADQAPVA